MPVGGISSFPAVAWPVAAFIGTWAASTIGALGLWMWKLR
jgi:hypothetical protein